MFDREKKKKMGRLTTEDSSTRKTTTRRRRRRERTTNDATKEEKTEKKGVVVSATAGVFSELVALFAEQHARDQRRRERRVRRASALRDEEVRKRHAEEDEGVSPLRTARRTTSHCSMRKRAHVGTARAGHQCAGEDGARRSWRARRFDRDGDDEKEKEDEEKDVFLLVTTSSDDAIRVCARAADATRARGAEYGACGRASSRLIRGHARVAAFSRYSAKKQPAVGHGHARACG